MATPQLAIEGHELHFTNESGEERVYYGGYGRAYKQHEPDDEYEFAPPSVDLEWVKVDTDPTVQVTGKESKWILVDENTTDIDTSSYNSDGTLESGDYPPRQIAVYEGVVQYTGENGHLWAAPRPQGGNFNGSNFRRLVIESENLVLKSETTSGKKELKVDVSHTNSEAPNDGGDEEEEEEEESPNDDTGDRNPDETITADIHYPGVKNPERDEEITISAEQTTTKNIAKSDLEYKWEIDGKSDKSGETVDVKWPNTGGEKNIRLTVTDEFGVEASIEKSEVRVTNGDISPTARVKSGDITQDSLPDMPTDNPKVTAYRLDGDSSFYGKTNESIEEYTWEVRQAYVAGGRDSDSDGQYGGGNGGNNPENASRRIDPAVTDSDGSFLSVGQNSEAGHDGSYLAVDGAGQLPDGVEPPSRWETVSHPGDENNPVSHQLIKEGVGYEFRLTVYTTDNHSASYTGPECYVAEGDDSGMDDASFTDAFSQHSDVFSQHSDVFSQHADIFAQAFSQHSDVFSQHADIFAQAFSQHSDVFSNFSNFSQHSDVFAQSFDQHSDFFSQHSDVFAQAFSNFNNSFSNFNNFFSNFNNRFSNFSNFSQHADIFAQHSDVFSNFSNFSQHSDVFSQHSDVFAQHSDVFSNFSDFSQHSDIFSQAFSNFSNSFSNFNSHSNFFNSHSNSFSSHSNSFSSHSNLFSNAGAWAREPTASRNDRVIYETGEEAELVGVENGEEAELFPVEPDEVSGEKRTNKKQTADGVEARPEDTEDTRLFKPESEAPENSLQPEPSEQPASELTDSGDPETTASLKQEGPHSDSLSEFGLGADNEPTTREPLDDEDEDGDDDADHTDLPHLNSPRKA